jgi:hypothetical protein
LDRTRIRLDPPFARGGLTRGKARGHRGDFLGPQRTFPARKYPQSRRALRAGSRPVTVLPMARYRPGNKRRRVRLRAG